MRGWGVEVVVRGVEVVVRWWRVEVSRVRRCSHERVESRGGIDWR